MMGYPLMTRSRLTTYTCSCIDCSPLHCQARDVAGSILELL